jgi:hypothetical protein
MMRITNSRWSPRLVPSSSFACGSAVLYVLGGITFAVADQPSFVQDGKAAFVVSEMQYALAPDADQTGACPDGMTQGIRLEAFGGPAAGAAGAGRAAAGSPGVQQPQGVSSSGQRPEGASPGAQQGAGGTEEEAQRRFFQNLTDPKRPNPCRNPQAVGPDPNFRTVKVPDIKAHGIDLDGRNSRAKGKPAPGTCAHDDLVGMNGERGIDNQFYRLVGCNKAYQSTGPGNTWTIEMHTGAWGVLITLAGLEDVTNDDSVEVVFAANADPIELSPNREPLVSATYAMDQDSRFRATTRGRIKDGVLITEPVDVRLHKITNSIYLERILTQARAQMTLSKDGVLEGYLAGYTPVEDLYNFEYAFRNGKNAKGEPADSRLILISSIGRAATLTYSCNGAYHAMHELADGDPDPATGKCTSISTQYRLKAIPAFVVEAKTQSVNDDLER